MKTILTILTLTIILSACGEEKAPSVLEYLHDPTLMKTNNGWCRSNPAQRESEKCLNLRQADRFTATAESVFFECTEPTGPSFYDYTPKHDCIDKKAAEMNIK